MSQTAASQPARIRLGTVANVDPQPLLVWLADLIRDAGRPEIADVTTTETWAVAVRCGDGAAAFVKVCHVAPATADAPERPSWPGPNTMTGDSPPRPPAANTSMRVSYFAGWLQHRIAQQGRAVASFAEVGAVGPHWPLFGLRVTVGGKALYLSIAGVAPDDGFDLTLPTQYEPAAELATR